MITTDLYQVDYIRNKLKVIEADNCNIIRKTLIIISKTKFPGDQKDITPIIEMLTQSTYHLFQYSYDVPYDAKVPFGKTTKRINVRICYKDTENDNIEYIRFAYLTKIQKLKNSFHFKNLWIQQTQNVMWLINMIILVLASVAALINVFC